jgi:transcriptional regulator with XRE-family HTH domain
MPLCSPHFFTSDLKGGRDVSPESVADRLRQALELSGTSVRQLSLELQKRSELKGRGTARSMIHRYLSGSARPPLEFLNAAAHALRVRDAWLVSGEEPRTDVELDAPGKWRRDAAVPIDVQGTLDEAFDAVFEECPDLKGRAGSFSTVRTLLLGSVLQEVTNRIYWQRGASEETEPRKLFIDMREAAVLMSRTLASPLRELGLDPSHWSELSRDQYVGQMLGLLLPLIEAENEMAIRRRKKEQRATQEED